MTDIIARCAEHGIDYKRLNACLSTRDNWGGMVHAYEYITVLGIVEDAMRETETA